MNDNILEEFKTRSKSIKNILFSPFGFDMAFRFLIENTIGETQKDILSLFAVQEDISIGKLFEELDHKKENLATDILNRIEVEYNRILSPNNIIKVQERYSHFAEIRYIESTDPKLEFQIRNILSFEENWLDDFEDMKEPNFFYINSTNKIVTKFIKQFIKNEKNKVKYYSDRELSAIQISLQSEKFVFEVYLPKELGSLRKMINSLSNDKLDRIIKNFYLPKYIEIVIPDFIVESNIEINKTNNGFGLTKMYFPSFDYRPLFDSNVELFIHKITQQNKIKVSKTGIKGKSKTIVYGGVGSLSNIGEHIIFEADHPFLYLLRDKASGICLFMGIYEEPVTELKTDFDNDLSEILIEEAKLIRKFKPNIHQITTRGRIYLGMECLNILAKEKGINILWAKEIIIDLMLYVSNDRKIAKEIQKVDFTSYEIVGYFEENKYFQLDESIDFRKKFAKQQRYYPQFVAW